MWKLTRLTARQTLGRWLHSEGIHHLATGRGLFNDKWESERLKHSHASGRFTLPFPVSTPLTGSILIPSFTTSHTLCVFCRYVPSKTDGSLAEGWICLPVLPSENSSAINLFAVCLDGTLKKNNSIRTDLPPKNDAHFFFFFFKPTSAGEVELWFRKSEELFCKQNKWHLSLRAK